MSLQDRIETLRARHRSLEEAIDQKSADRCRTWRRSAT